jgi:hypothetical protein
MNKQLGDTLILGRDHLQGEPGMITEKDIIQAGEQEKQLTTSYLKGIIDFVKWTSTVAIAATLWIGNSITPIVGLSRIMIIAGLAFLIGSLVVAVFAIRRVLTAWATEWDRAREEYSLLLLKKWKAIKPSGVTEQKETEQIKRVIDAIDATRPFSQPTGFQAWISLHAAFLLAGLILYLVAQILGTL